MVANRYLIVAVAWLLLAPADAQTPLRAWVIHEGYLGAIDSSGQWAIPPRYENAHPFSGGVAPVRDGGKWGLMTYDGRWLLTPQFDQLGPIADGYMAANRSGWRVELMDLEGRSVIAPSFGTGYQQKLTAPAYRRWIAVDPATGLYGILTLDGDTLFPFELSFADTYHEGWLRAVHQGNWLLLDTSATQRVQAPEGTEWLGEVGAGLAWLRREGRWELMDTLGRTRTLKQNAYEFLEATDDRHPGRFSYGLAAVRIGAGWGYLNPAGQQVIASEFEAAGDYFEGLAPVRVRGKWGYIDTRSRWVIPPSFDFAHPFSR